MEGEEVERLREEARLLPRSDAAWPAENELEVVLPDSHKPAPFWAWILLVFSVLAFTSSGIVFSMMPEVPFLTLASWRLQATSWLLLPPCLVELVLWTSAETRCRILQSWGLLAANGVLLGTHFGLWVLSLQLTSLPHAMLFVTMSPAIVALSSWVRGRPISRGELAGTALGVAGGALLALTSVHHGGGGERDPSWQGDACALAAASLFVIHLEMGRRLRSFTPMLTYSAVVTSLAAGVLVLGGTLLEGSGLLGDRRGHASFGALQWLVDRRYIGKILILAILPGIVGHVGFNTLIKHMDALILTLAGSVEPLLGAWIGYALGLVSAPPLLTYIGGFTVITSTVIVSIAGHFR
ncbi:hypothetical protein QBZ16_000781 [Prototheca wickerhamii]|uniref:EamA domain-containing protein n=1 Tax=Prototheca wickerhamii TaxID=3111 RepID=A0AAD9MK47_PROWI|nr:hypothetical protein QBZ16_000781 [Prototheca wickerhamii]